MTNMDLATEGTEDSVLDGTVGTSSDPIATLRTLVRVVGLFITYAVGNLYISNRYGLLQFAVSAFHKF